MIVEAVSVPPDPPDPYLEISPEARAEAYHADFQRFLDEGALERARCVANITATLGIATPEEARLNRERPGLSIDRLDALPDFDADLWSLILHPDLPEDLGHIMAVLHVYCGHLYSDRISRSWRLNEDSAIPLERAAQRFEVYRLLSLFFERFKLRQPPRVYRAPNRALGLINANANPPAIIVGKDVSTRWHPHDVCFAVARQVMMCRPEHYPVGAGFSTEALVEMFEGLIWLLSEPRRRKLWGQSRLQKALLEMLPPVQQRLEPLLEPYLDANIRHTVITWRNAVAASAARLGLVICGDLGRALQRLRSDRNTPSTLRFEHREDTLYSYARSEKFFAARERLDLAGGPR